VATGCAVLVRYDLRLLESTGIYEFAVRTHLRVPTPFVVIMVALCNRADHYIFALWFLSSFFFLSFPFLISAVGDWMSTVLPHMVRIIRTLVNHAKLKRQRGREEFLYRL